MTARTPYKPKPIRTGEAWPLQQFMRATGLSHDALRRAKRRGLRTVQVGRRAFVLAESWLEYLRAEEQRQQAAREGGEV